MAFPAAPEAGQVNMLGYHTKLPSHVGKSPVRRIARFSRNSLKTGRMLA